jgi:hypothetical protein
MSVADFPAPYVGESDLVSLSPFFDIIDGYLVDEITGAKHQLHPLAAASLKLLSYPRTASSWKAESAALGVDSASWNQLFQFCLPAGALTHRASIVSTLRYILSTIYFYALGVEIIPWKQRFPASSSQIALALFRLFRVQLFVTLCLIGAGVYIPFFSAPGLYFSITLGLVLFSIWAHEVAHLMLLRPRPCCLVRSGWSLVILYRKNQNVKQETHSAWIGPLVGITFSVLGSLILSTSVPFLWIAGSIIALIHASSLLPSAADGRILFRTNQRHARNS